MLYCYSNCPFIDITDQESDRHHSNVSHSIIFHIYHLISRCTAHGRLPPDEKKSCCLCSQYPSTVTPSKQYTRKDLVMMDISTADFNTSFYIPEIKKLEFHLPHVRVLGTNHCSNTLREAFKCRIKIKICCVIVIMIK